MPLTVSARTSGRDHPCAPGRLRARPRSASMQCPSIVIHVPAEGAPLIGQRLDRHHVLHAEIVLQVVAVHDHREVVELPLGGRHGRLPDGSFLALTVADHHPHMVVFLAQLAGERHAQPGRNTLAERPSGHVHPGGLVHVRVALQDAAQLAQGRRGASCRNTRARPAPRTTPGRRAPWKARSGRGRASRGSAGRCASPGSKAPSRRRSTESEPPG